MIKFGTGGWRAIIAEEYTKENVRKVCQAIADYCSENADTSKEKAIVIGYDRRFLSKESAEWAASVFGGNDFKVYILDEHGPTPMTMFTIGDMNLEFGIAITASHNHAEYNGIKFFVDGGRDAPVEITNDIEKRIAKTKNKHVSTSGFKHGLATGIIEYINPLFDYINRIKSLLDINTISKENLRVLVDPMYGSGKTALPAMLFNIGVRADSIHDNHDVLFGGQHPSPSSSNLVRLKELVVKDGYDLGIATDGDADRLGIVTETGQYLHPNDILVLLYYYFLKYKNIQTPVVRNIATTHLLDRIARAFNQEAIEVPVGFKNITEGMQASGAHLGGESSGGLATVGHIRGKDGVYAAAIICEVIANTGKSLSALLNEIYEQFGELYMYETNFNMTEEAKSEIYNRLFVEKEVPEFNKEIAKISYDDGMKIYFTDDSWILTRFSGTEPVIRIYAEQETRKATIDVCKEMQEFLGIPNGDLSDS